MNIIILAQITATGLFCITLAYIAYFAVSSIRLQRLFKPEYIKYIQTRNVRRLYPLVPKHESQKYNKAKQFLVSVGWKISVEGIYLCKWGLFTTILFLLVTMQTTNVNVTINEIIEDVNYRKNIIEPTKNATTAFINQEKRLFLAVDKTIFQSREL